MKRCCRYLPDELVTKIRGKLRKRLQACAKDFEKVAGVVGLGVAAWDTSVMAAICPARHPADQDTKRRSAEGMLARDAGGACGGIPW